ncbi:sensor histidine kinase [Marinicaulis aureus]|uniref:histidine kinase n=1 Tax=Hyphococcus aureus TaxID=2666033 RepID=A0ABW1KQT8_9PROT
MTLTRRQRGLIAFVSVGMGLLVLFAAAAAAFFVNQASTRADALVTHTITIITEALKYQSSIQGAVIGERAYLITRDEQYLTDYETALSDYEEARQTIRELTRDNPAQQLRLDNIDIQAKNITDSLMRAVKNVAAGDGEDRETLVRRSNVDALLAQFNDMISILIQEEQTLLQTRRVEQNRTDRLVGQIILGSLAIISGLLLLQLAMLREQNRLQTVRTTEILELNTELEQHVAERTKELEEAKISLEEENLRVESLLRDLHHRVGNSLQLVASFLSLQANQVGGEEAKSTLRAARGRVLSIAATQRRLAMNTNHEVVASRHFIEQIVADLKTNLNFEQNINITTDVGNFNIPSRDAVTIGVLVSEMVTNAAKYAFSGRESGFIRVTFDHDPSAEQCVLIVEDDGVGLSDGPANPHGGLGRRIIDSLVAALGGEIERGESGLGQGPGLRLAVIYPFSPAE